jgi:hypothetical protein
MALEEDYAFWSTIAAGFPEKIYPSSRLSLAFSVSVKHNGQYSL